MAVREIIHDDKFLSQKSEPATKDDLEIGANLVDTLKAHRHHCIGLAANMIGELKRIIVVAVGEDQILMYNPEIVKHSAKKYATKEGCLCRSEELPCTRYASIEVKYRDAAFKKQREKFSGLTAQIIQHELDHCNGIII